MSLPSHPKIYDQIGTGYRGNRIPDPRIAVQIREAIGNAQSVVNIGAGTGSYEPTDVEVVAVEPSELMIQQRRSNARVVQATAESLPFQDQEFDVAMTVLSLHHWESPQKGIAEMKRVSKRQVILTFDPNLVSSFWLARNYFPEFIEMDRERGIQLDSLAKWLGNNRVAIVPIPYDCSDGFLAAYWRRPYEYLKPHVRKSISSFAQLAVGKVEKGIRQLEIDLDDGVWLEKNGDLIDRKEMDYGYRLLSSC